ncbi:MAG: LLM class F420-dependent oxidoreductase, partial [Deltaproteobacteria bacterium]|nr:LLM class F420-dependent oxidoreductase [Deltaproteobacteria bacterium]
SDAVSPAAWILARTEKINVGTAIMQMPGRTPAMAAMTAMTLQAMSGGRFILGLGPSGPQVVEGWHGVAYGRPLTRTREYISIIRDILAREERVTHEGFHYQMPYKGKDATGLGKPLKSILHGDPALKIFTASISPKGMECASEVADGVFPIWMSPERFDVFEASLEKGFAKAGGGKSLESFEVAPFVTCIMSDDLEKARIPIKNNMALYIGGMGARGRNFYNDYAKRLGYEEAAVQIQDLFLDGKKREAAEAVPDALVDEVALVGPEARIRDRLQVWKEAGKKRHVGSMLIGGGGPALRVLAEELL